MIVVFQANSSSHCCSDVDNGDQRGGPTARRPDTRHEPGYQLTATCAGSHRQRIHLPLQYADTLSVFAILDHFSAVLGMWRRRAAFQRRGMPAHIRRTGYGSSFFHEKV